MDPDPEVWILDPTIERVSRRVIRHHMERLWREADKDRCNKTNSWELNIQTANVSMHLRQLAEKCCQFSHRHLDKLIYACRLLRAWHKDVRHVDIMGALKQWKGQQQFDYHKDHQEFLNFQRSN